MILMKRLMYLILLGCSITLISKSPVFGSQKTLTILTFDEMKNMHGGVGCGEFCNSTSWNCEYCPDGTNVTHCTIGHNEKKCQSPSDYSCIEDPSVDCGRKEQCQTGSSLHCFNCTDIGNCAPYFQCHTKF